MTRSIHLRNRRATQVSCAFWLFLAVFFGVIAAGEGLDTGARVSTSAATLLCLLLAARSLRLGIHVSIDKGRVCLVNYWSSRRVSFEDIEEFRTGRRGGAPWPLLVRRDGRELPVPLLNRGIPFGDPSRNPAHWSHEIAQLNQLVGVSP